MRGGQTNISGNLLFSTCPNVQFRGASTDPDPFCASFALYDQADSTDACAIKVGQGASNAFNRVSYKGINILDFKTTTVGRSRYGIYSGLGTSSDGVNYNFYAAGAAPNYFAGVLRVATDVNTPGNGNIFTGVTVGSADRVFISNEDAGGLTVNRNTAGEVVYFRYRGGTGQAGEPSAGTISVTGTKRTVYSCGQNSVASGFITESDYRLKENIADLPSAVNAVKALKPKTFNYIGSTETVQGFVAHELQEVNSFFATGTKDETEAVGTYTDAEGNVETEVTEPEAIPFGATWEQTGTRDVYQGVDATKLIPLLTKALQEVIAENEDIKTRLAALEGA